MEFTARGHSDGHDGLQATMTKEPPPPNLEAVNFSISMLIRNMRGKSRKNTWEDKWRNYFPLGMASDNNQRTIFICSPHLEDKIIEFPPRFLKSGTENTGIKSSLVDLPGGLEELCVGYFHLYYEELASGLLLILCAHKQEAISHTY